MSDIKLYEIKKKRVYEKLKPSKINIKKVVEGDSENLFGITVIASNLVLSDDPTEVIETLGYDENFRLVLIEYRFGKFTNLIKKGLVLIDYIRSSPTKVKLLLTDKKVKNISSINFNPRLIIIGDDFNNYDAHAIKQMPYEIDLIKYQLFDDALLVFEKVYQTNKELIYNKSLITNPLFPTIHQFIMSLGDEVVSYGNEHYVSYRKIKNFLYIVLSDPLVVKVKLNGVYKDLNVKTKSDCDKAIKQIEQSYDNE